MVEAFSLQKVVEMLEEVIVNRFHRKERNNGLNGLHGRERHNRFHRKGRHNGFYGFHGKGE